MWFFLFVVNIGVIRFGEGEKLFVRERVFVVGVIGGRYRAFSGYSALFGQVLGLWLLYGLFFFRFFFIYVFSSCCLFCFFRMNSFIISIFFLWICWLMFLGMFGMIQFIKSFMNMIRFCKESERVGVRRRILEMFFIFICILFGSILFRYSVLGFQVYFLSFSGFRFLEGINEVGFYLAGFSETFVDFFERF